MNLQIILPHVGRIPARPEPVAGVLYRCAAAWPICAFCAHALGRGEESRCPACLVVQPPERVQMSCSMYGVIELRDAKNAFHGSLCQGHARAVLAIPGARLAQRTSRIDDMVEEHLGRLFNVPAHQTCSCAVGESLGPNLLGDVRCDLCGKLMVAATMAVLTELLGELREHEPVLESPHA